VLEDFINFLWFQILLFNLIPFKVSNAIFYSPSLQVSVQSIKMPVTVPEGLPKVEYRFLGRSGLHVSAISIGEWLTIGGHVDNGKQF
jgi:hypothetical protein